MGRILHAKVGDRLKRNDTGGIVRVVSVRPNGLEVFYVCEDVRDGHTVIMSARDLRPAAKKPKSE